MTESYRGSMETGSPESFEQNYRRERQAAFRSAQMALDSSTQENEAVVLAILTLGHQVRMAALDIVDGLSS